MKTHHLFFLCIATFFCINKSIAQTEEDSQQITQIVNGVTIFFYEQKLDLFADLWDKDATFISVMGLKAVGKADIVDMHAMGKYVIDSSTKTIVEPPIINFITKDIAVAYSVWGGLVFKLSETETTPVDSGFLTVVLKKSPKGWKIVSATNALNVMRGMPFQFEKYSHDETWTKWGLGDKK